MNVVGIIAEYNPFHKGHAYHIARAKELCHADACVVIMSPDFVQRGEPAIMSKYDRARAALLCGADCVLELPVSYATGAARTFAEAGVALLDKLGIVTHLCFGSECGDVTPLAQIADVLAQEPEQYTAELKRLLKAGVSYPSANEQALRIVLGTDTAKLAASPNNILAVEYLRALQLRHSTITPITITRTGDYNNLNMAADLSSASAIRHHVAQKNDDTTSYIIEEDRVLLEALPQATHELIQQQYKRSMPILTNDFSGALHYYLLTHTKEDLSAIEDITSDLANQIYHLRDHLTSFDAFAERCKSRQYTRTRINRALLHAILGITQKDVRAAQQRDYGNYVRLLGFRRSFKSWLTEIKNKSSLVLITKVASAESQLSTQDYADLQKTLFSSDLYRAAASAKYDLQPTNEYTHGLILLP